MGLAWRFPIARARVGTTRPGARRFGAAAALVAMLAVPAFPGHATAQETFGVFIGINDYVEFGDEPGGDLLGAEGDALLMRSVLMERWGMLEENSLTLLSLEATKEAIRDATIWLAEQAGPDDLAVFYFAGHGAQVYDLDGDEPDGLDETLAPTDVQRFSSINDIRDDEFRAWLAEVDADVVVILDSCHSGTATRGSEMRTRSLEREIPPEDGEEPEVVRQAYDPETMADGTGHVTEIAAAAPNQSALEGPFPTDSGDAIEQRGAFTYFLVQELLSAAEDDTYEGVVASVAERLLDEDFMQSPQSSGDAQAKLFSRNER